eukprot:jgi/Mesvir1/24728/Mv21993-RA.1
MGNTYWIWQRLNSSGLSSGLKNVTKGLISGIAALIACPFIGAKEKGATGFAIGAVEGLVSAVALPLMGLGTGLYQFGRGVIYTPEALAEHLADKMWDKDKRRWYSYSLKAEAEELKNEEASTHGSSATSGGGASKETQLYDILGVAPSASHSEIKRAYYQKALAFHPDKNPHDPEAHKKFQQVGAAYQVLSDDRLRARYDAEGAASIDEKGLVGSSELFMFVFGSERFEDWVGELMLMRMQDVAMPSATSPDGKLDAEGFLQQQAALESQMKKRQHKREVACAVHLAEILDLYVHPPDGDVGQDAFRSKIRAAAQELSSTAFGGTLIAVLAHVYEEQAVKHLGFRHGVPAGLGLRSAAEKAHMLAVRFRVLASALRAYKTERLSNIMETMWFVTVVDVEGTLRAVCNRVLKDLDVSDKERHGRAEGLLAIAECFRKCGKSLEDGMRELAEKIQLDETMAQAQARAEEQAAAVAAAASAASSSNAAAAAQAAASSSNAGSTAPSTVAGAAAQATATGT